MESFSIDDLTGRIVQALGLLERDDRIAALNRIRERLHGVSPFSHHPIDLVRWVRAEKIIANDYNPNSVAAPEMTLLGLSIEADGYTQPIVAMDEEGRHEVVDGFHRNRVGREMPSVADDLDGYLPVTNIRIERQGRSDRIASTIRHNRARGKHGIDAMSAIVVDLARRKWADDRIARELGMEPDEVLRLKQISGLAEIFRDCDFSAAWEIDEDALHA